MQAKWKVLDRWRDNSVREDKEKEERKNKERDKD
jgi:hypothetical protein